MEHLHFGDQLCSPKQFYKRELVSFMFILFLQQRLTIVSPNQFSLLHNNRIQNFNWARGNTKFYELLAYLIERYGYMTKF